MRTMNVTRSRSISLILPAAISRSSALAFMRSIVSSSPSRMQQAAKFSGIVSQNLWQLRHQFCPPM